MDDCAITIGTMSDKVTVNVQDGERMHSFELDLATAHNIQYALNTAIRRVTQRVVREPTLEDVLQDLGMPL